VRLDVRAATALSAQPIGVLSPPACVLTDDAARAPQSAPPEVLREVDASTGPALLRPDSEYAIGIATGLSLPTTNRVLAQRVRRMWQDEEERRGGQLWALDTRLACLEHCLQHEHGPQVGTARRRVRAAHRLLSDPARQRTEAERLVAAGLKPALVAWRGACSGRLCGGLTRVRPARTARPVPTTPGRQFLSGPNREAILAEVGMHFFGPRVH